jgi:hypothetical protein
LGLGHELSRQDSLESTTSQSSRANVYRENSERERYTLRRSETSYHDHFEIKRSPRDIYLFGDSPGHYQTELGSLTIRNKYHKSYKDKYGPRTTIDITIGDSKVAENKIDNGLRENEFEAFTEAGNVAVGYLELLRSEYGFKTTNKTKWKQRVINRKAANGEENKQHPLGQFLYDHRIAWNTYWSSADAVADIDGTSSTIISHSRKSNKVAFKRKYGFPLQMNEIPLGNVPPQNQQNLLSEGMDYEMDYSSEEDHSSLMDRHNSKLSLFTDPLSTVNHNFKRKKNRHEWNNNHQTIRRSQEVAEWESSVMWKNDAESNDFDLEDMDDYANEYTDEEDSHTRRGFFSLGGKDFIHAEENLNFTSRWIMGTGKGQDNSPISQESGKSKGNISRKQGMLLAETFHSHKSDPLNWEKLVAWNSGSLHYIEQKEAVYETRKKIIFDC